MANFSFLQDALANSAVDALTAVYGTQYQVGSSTAIYGRLLGNQTTECREGLKTLQYITYVYLQFHLRMYQSMLMNE